MDMRLASPRALLLRSSLLSPGHQRRWDPAERDSSRLPDRSRRRRWTMEREEEETMDMISLRDRSRETREEEGREEGTN